MNCILEKLKNIPNSPEMFKKLMAIKNNPTTALQFFSPFFLIPLFFLWQLANKRCERPSGSEKLNIKTLLFLLLLFIQKLLIVIISSFIIMTDK